jgi:predicted RNA-binding protein with PUA-like domain
MGKKTHNYWLVKQEPTDYPWEQFVRDGQTEWTGVRNFQAKNNLSKMAVGDEVLYYHSNVGKEIVGTATVVRTAKPDPTDSEEQWVSVLLKVGRALKKPVSLEMIKKDPLLKNMALVRQSRLSVMPVSHEEWQRVLELGGI